MATIKKESMAMIMQPTKGYGWGNDKQSYLAVANRNDHKWLLAANGYCITAVRDDSFMVNGVDKLTSTLYTVHEQTCMLEPAHNFVETQKVEAASYIKNIMVIAEPLLSASEAPNIRAVKSFDSNSVPYQPRTRLKLHATFVVTEDAADFIGLNCTKSTIDALDESKYESLLTVDCFNMRRIDHPKRLIAGDMKARESVVTGPVAFDISSPMDNVIDKGVTAVHIVMPMYPHWARSPRVVRNT